MKLTIASSFMAENDVSVSSCWIVGVKRNDLVSSVIAAIGFSILLLDRGGETHLGGTRSGRAGAVSVSSCWIVGVKQCTQPHRASSLHVSVSSCWIVGVKPRMVTGRHVVIMGFSILLLDRGGETFRRLRPSRRSRRFSILLLDRGGETQHRPPAQRHLFRFSILLLDRGGETWGQTVTP